jgi:L-arabonate dehydrase
MLNGKFENENVGSGTDLRRMAADVAAGKMSSSRFAEAGRSITRSEGTCNTMGTASTMASMAKGLGMALSGNAAIPAVDSRRGRVARMSGRRIV